MEYYAAIKKKELLPFATAWMELESIMLSKISQSEKDKYNMIHSYMGYNDQDNLMNKNRSRDREALIRPSNLRGKVGKGEGKGERSTKGFVCMHLSQTNGHRHQGGKDMSGGWGGIWEIRAHM